MDTSELPRQGANLSANRVEFSSSVTPASLPVPTLRLRALERGWKCQRNNMNKPAHVSRWWGWGGRGEGREESRRAGVKRFVEKKNGSNRSGLGRGQHQQLRSRSANIEKCSGRSAQHRKSGHCFCRTTNFFLYWHTTNNDRIYDVGHQCLCKKIKSLSKFRL